MDQVQRRRVEAACALGASDYNSGVSSGFISIAMPDTGEPRPYRMANYSTCRVVGETPYICAAAPGIRTSADLPQIVPILA